MMYTYKSVDFNPFEDISVQKTIELNNAQKEIWLSCAIGGEAANLVYNECSSLELKGKINKQALEQSIIELVSRHEALRCNFDSTGDSIHIYPDPRVILVHVDCTKEDKEASKQALATFIEKQISTPFDLVTDPLLRTSLCRLSEDDHVLVFTIHHIIGDGWSQKLLFKELSDLYTFHVGNGKKLGIPSVQMSDFLREEKEFANSEEYRQNEDYWFSLFKDHVPETNLITDFERPQLRSFRGNRIDVRLPDGMLAELKKISLEKNCSLIVLLLSAFEVFLSKKTAQQELVVALPTAGQLASGQFDLVGHYVTTIPIKSSIEKQHTFGDYLGLRKPAILDALDHQRFSLRTLVKRLQIPRDLSRIPLIPIMFNVDLGIDDGVSFQDLDLHLINNPSKYQNFELFLNIYGTQGMTTLECSYNSDIFRANTIRKMMEEYSFLLTQIIKDPNVVIKDLFLEDPQLHLDKLRIWNDTFSPYSKDHSLLDLFEMHSIEQPNRVALSFGAQNVSYQEINRQANQLAHLLIAEEVLPGDTIGIIMNRSIEMIVSLLASIKCGAVIVPIDPEFPNDRVLYMLGDSEAKSIITNRVFVDRFKSNAKLIIIEDRWKELTDFPDKNPEKRICGSDLIYILYTSGSTGKPKGVQIQHHNLLNFLLSMQKAPGIHRDDKVLATTTISFDICMLEIFLPLISGAQIVLLDEKHNRNGKSILDTIRKEKVTIMQGGPALYNVMLYEDWHEKLPLKILCGGEALPKDLAEKLLSRCTEVWNMYGPTETTVWSTIKKLSIDDERITVGNPIDNTQIYILDETMALVPEGQMGEIYIAGDGLALGYLKRPELTDEKFIKNPFLADDSARIYGTGDLGMRMSNGEILCLGRLDHQVKIRGIRIELGEIEQTILQKEGVKEVIVVVRQDHPEIKNLCAYIIPTEEWDNQTETEFKIIWRESLKQELPIYMVPHDFIVLSSFPLTPNGKIDRKALPKPDLKRPELATLYAAPTTEVEKKLASIWASALQIDKVGRNDNFFDMGGDSLTAVKSVAALKQYLGYDLPITNLYQFPTIKKMGELIHSREGKKGVLNGVQNENKVRVPLTISNSTEETSTPIVVKGGDIAVIAMTGRFPKSNNVDELWTMLKEGKEGTSFFEKDELDQSIPEVERNDPDYVAARGIISGVENFEPGFFGIHERLAQLMDPQQRIFLEICWEALEECGYTDQHYNGNIGVFAGCANGSYFIENVQHHKRLIENVGSFQVQLMNEKDYLSSRVAYAMNLKGPAVTVQSACSTSLLAIAQAVDSLRSGKCDMALAGGVSVILPINSGHIYQEGSMQSADGHCRPFDSEASGTIFSDGAGVVLLKPLEAARRDGDTIYAIVKGIGMCNDGAGKGSFTAPSSDGQAEAIAMALKDAQFGPETISYIETHGTATPLGDPIEFEGLKQAFGIQSQRQFCAIGSVKSNIGHLNTAAGVTGFIKTCLSLYHKQIPPSINYVRPNPHINIQDSPFYVNTRLSDWTLNDGTATRRAGISSFGVGGTNVHISLEENQSVQKTRLDRKPFALINWSAKSEVSRELYREKLLCYLEGNPNLKLWDLAYSLQSTRSDFNFRQFVIASSNEDLVDQLMANSEVSRYALTENIEEVAFVFPGQGSQYFNMGKELYEVEPVFKIAVDECVELLQGYMNENILDVIFSSCDEEKGSEKLNNTYYTQPALFVIEYAVAKLMMSWGILPAVFIGHSIGEFVAAHLSGIFSLKDALFLISTRGKLMAGLPAGKMLAIRSKHEDILAILPSSLSMAAINSPGLCVVAGSCADVAAFSSLLEGKMVANTLLHTSHAFHSLMMDEIVAPYKQIIETITFRKPTIPIISSVTGTWMTDVEAQNPHYWACHLRSSVNFLEASRTLLDDKKRYILECGPGNVLSTLLKQQGYKGILSSPSLDLKNERSESFSITHTLGQLWLHGIPVDWKAYYGHKQIHKIKLPSYAFARKKYWVPPIQADGLQIRTEIETPSHHPFNQ